MKEEKRVYSAWGKAAEWKIALLQISREDGGFGFILFVLLETDVCLLGIELPEELTAELTDLQKATE